MLELNKVLVVGDLMLDEYYEGSVSRISPEAPIPIVEIRERKIVLGGAANVAANIRSLGGTVETLGFVGMDESGDDIIRLLRKHEIRNENILRSNDIKTIKKTRVIGNDQQITRLDFNDRILLDKDFEQRFKTLFDAVVSNYNVVIISDYGKGTCTHAICRHVINKCIRNGITVIVDPKGVDWDKYRGASFVTPNVRELSDIYNLKIDNRDDTIEKVAGIILEKYELENILVTRSAKGMSLLTNNGKIIHMPSKALEVYDVSGAGDTVVACFALYVNLIPAETLMEYANICAGIAVGKRGTSVVTKDELLSKLQTNSLEGIQRKIIDVAQLTRIIEDWRTKGEKIVFTNGCFDIIHKGHISSIYAAAKFGTKLIVALNSDESVRLLKGNDRPINKLYDREIVIAALGCVDAVISFEEETPLELIKKVRPDVLVKSGDYKKEDVVGGQFAGKVEIVPYIDGYSTTSTINSMNR